MDREQLHELLLQALEIERGSVRVYESALEVAVDSRLREEWRRYLEETRRHERVVQRLLAELGLEAHESPGRAVTRALGESLVGAIRLARNRDAPEAAQCVACECILLAETREHLNWELICAAAQSSDRSELRGLRAASASVQDEEDEHLFHGAGWCRELWLQRLGLAPLDPRPEGSRRSRS